MCKEISTLVPVLSDVVGQERPVRVSVPAALSETREGSSASSDSPARGAASPAADSRPAARPQRFRLIQSVTATANRSGSSKNGWCPLCSKICSVALGNVDAMPSHRT
jgi:hypothetical protein